MSMFLRNTLLGAVVSMLVSGASLAEERTVRIYNWIEYLPPEILKSFEEETASVPSTTSSTASRPWSPNS